MTTLVFAVQVSRFRYFPVIYAVTGKHSFENFVIS